MLNARKLAKMFHANLNIIKSRNPLKIRMLCKIINTLQENSICK